MIRASWRRLLQVLVTDELEAEGFDLAQDAGADEGVEFILEFIEGGVGVKLGIAGGQSREQAQKVGLINARVLQQAEHPVGVADATAGQHRACPKREQMKNGGVQRAIAQMA